MSESTPPRAHRANRRGDVGALTNLGSTMVFTLVPIVLLRILGLDEATYGLLLTVSAVGGLLGSIFAARIARLIGEGPTLAVSTIVFATSAILLPIAVAIPSLAVPLLFVFEVLLGSSVLVYNIVQVTARQRLCPKPLLGRMNASIRFLVWGVMPLGALISGVVGEQFGTMTSVWVGIAITTLGGVPMVFSRFARMRELPVRPDEALLDAAAADVAPHPESSESR